MESELFKKLEQHSKERGVPYSWIIEELVREYLNEPEGKSSISRIASSLGFKGWKIGNEIVIRPYLGDEHSRKS